MMTDENEGSDENMDLLDQQSIASPQLSVPSQPSPPMKLPELTASGMLPAGIHTATLPEVERVFGSTNPRRIELWRKFLQWFSEMQHLHIGVSIFIDGSFTTDKAEPGDIDVVVELPLLSTFEQRPLTPQVMQRFSELISQTPMKAMYELDVWSWNPGTPPKTNYDLIDFFQKSVSK